MLQPLLDILTKVSKSDKVVHSKKQLRQTSEHSNHFCFQAENSNNIKNKEKLTIWIFILIETIQLFTNLHTKKIKNSAKK